MTAVHNNHLTYCDGNDSMHCDNQQELLCKNTKKYNIDKDFLIENWKTCTL